MAEQWVINGKKVVWQGPLRWRFKSNAGSNFVEQFEELELEDHSIVYRCLEAECDWLGGDVKQFVGHRRAHSEVLPPGLRNVTLAEIVAGYSRDRQRGGLAVEERIRQAYEKGRSEHSTRVEELKSKVGALTKELKELRKRERNIQRMLRPLSAREEGGE